MLSLQDLQMSNVKDLEDQAIGAGILSMKSIMFNDQEQVREKCRKSLPALMSLKHFTD
jgi:hypothetical protein